VKKDKGANKKFEKTGKARRAYIAWQDNDDSSSSSSSEEDEETNVFDGISSNTYVNFENYSQVLDAFKEPHEEANRTTLLNNRLKGLNNWLENRVKTFEEDLINSKTDFENLEMIYQNSSCKCVDSSFCENCDSLQKKVHYLLKTMDKFSKDQSNLEIFLASPNCVFLARLDRDLIQTARTNLFQNLSQVSLKNNLLFC